MKESSTKSQAREGKDREVSRREEIHERKDMHVLRIGERDDPGDVQGIEVGNGAYIPPGRHMLGDVHARCRSCI
jgi:hypothetical protein